MMLNDGRAVSTKPPICVEGATNAGRGGGGGGVIDTALPDGRDGKIDVEKLVKEVV